MAKAEERHTDGDVVTVDWYECNVSKLSLENIVTSEFDFSFLTDESEAGVLGNVNKIIEILQSYSTAKAYDVDGKNNFEDALQKLTDEVEKISGELGDLKKALEDMVKDIKTEIETNYNWAYSASFSHGTDQISSEV